MKSTERRIQRLEKARPKERTPVDEYGEEAVDRAERIMNEGIDWQCADKKEHIPGFSAERLAQFRASGNKPLKLTVEEECLLEAVQRALVSGEGSR